MHIYFFSFFIDFYISQYILCECQEKLFTTYENVE